MEEIIPFLIIRLPFGFYAMIIGGNKGYNSTGQQILFIVGGLYSLLWSLLMPHSQEKIKEIVKAALFEYLQECQKKE